MRYIAAAVLLATAAFTTGCYISSDKHGDGDNVKVATPFGGLSVKTDQDDVLSGIALPVYPGATLAKKDKINGKENGSADVNMSFGSFQLRVKAVSYRTPDDPQKVLAFYRKALGRFGTVIQCDGSHSVGQPTRTPEGLTCDESMNHGKIQESVSDSKIQLKAGSKKHQHIVDVDPDGSGSKFGLVALDLPVDFHFGDKDDKETDGKDNKE